MASTIAAVANNQIQNMFSSTKAEDFAIDCVRVTLSGEENTVLYCNHIAQSSIDTVSVREALLVIATASNSVAYAENVAQAGAIITTTSFTGDTITVYGKDGGIYDVLIIGRAK